jgi:DNA polymerase III epsilon subunit-like protein
MNQPSGNIIEIGAVCLDIKKQEITGQFSQIVRLPDTEILSPDIIKLTGITDVDLCFGKPLPEALNDFWDWCQHSGCLNFIAAWG